MTETEKREPIVTLVSYQLPSGKPFSFMVENHNPPYVPPVKGQVKRTRQITKPPDDFQPWWLEE